jgi:hypothetical protein
MTAHHAERIGDVGGQSGADGLAAVRLRAAWLRRDADALSHLFSYCKVPSVALPTLDGKSDDLDSAARRALHTMGEHLEDDHEVAEAVLAVGLYFHALLGWEGTDDFDEISEFVSAAAESIETLASTSSFRSVRAARQMLESIPYQCRTEEARLCACSYSMQLIAQEVVDYLRTLDIARHGVHEIDQFLLDVVRRDAENTAAFYALLADVISPLAGRFADVILDVSDAQSDGLSIPRAELQSDIRDALPEIRDAARELSTSGEVLGGELAVQADALERMADALNSPSLALDHGQLIFVYPFTLDDPEPGTGIEALREYALPLCDGEGGSVPFRFEEVQRTDAWDSLAEGAAEVFTAFQDRGELVLADGYELRFRPKWIEMDERRGAIEPGEDFHVLGLRAVLGSHGGHYLHLQTQVAERAGTGDPDPWSGAHVDQWVRRLGPDAGPDRVSLHRNGDMVMEWNTLHEFAQSLVRAIDDVEHPGDGARSEDAADLFGATVLLVADAVRVIEPDGQARPLRHDDDLERIVGYTALMASTRYLPASVEEWIRLSAPGPDNLLDGLRPLGDVLLVNGEVMTLLPLGSPNWVVLEQVEILEFAISLHGYLQHLTDRLRRRLRSEELSGVSPTIEQVSADIKVGNSVLELLRSRGLMRSRYHSDLLARIFASTGAHELDMRVQETVEALRDVRRELEEEARNRLSENLNLTLFWLTVVTVFVALHQFVASFFDEDAGALGEIGIVAIAGAATAALALGYRHIRQRNALSSGAR